MEDMLLLDWPRLQVIKKRLPRSLYARNEKASGKEHQRILGYLSAQGAAVIRRTKSSGSFGFSIFDIAALDKDDKTTLIAMLTTNM